MRRVYAAGRRGSRWARERRWLELEVGARGDMQRFEIARHDQRDPVVLIEGIRSARFEYRGLDETGKLGEWEEEWDEPGTQPVLVRMKFDMDERSRYIWPEIVVPVLANSANAGFYDPFYGSITPGGG